MTTQVSDAVVGRLLDGRYRVGEQVARGGMATVYVGVDTRLDRPVAIKVMHAAYAHDEAFVARFTREARSAAKLSHPNVVAVYDQGDDDGTVFLVMEYVEGRTLRDLLTERGRLSPAEAFDVMEPVLAALAAAHTAGLVHRDVKPENVLLADDGRIKVADFGLARAASAAGSSQATKGLLIGTVAYLSPEQVDRGIADARSDVYSAGIVLFELLTGQPPFSADSPMTVAFKHVHDDVPPPSTLRPGLHPAVDSLVTRATRRDPDERPADAARLLAAVGEVRRLVPPNELVEDSGSMAPSASNDTLVVALPDTNAGAAPSGKQDSAPRAGAGAVGPPPEGPYQKRRSKGWRILIALLLLVALAAGAGWASWWYGAGRWTTTPSVLGMSQSEATSTLTAAGLQAELGKPVFSETVKAGLVYETDPAPTERIQEGSTVSLILSKGPERFDVPSVVGKPRADAAKQIRSAGLTVGEVTKVYSDSVAEGDVIRTTPKAGTPVRAETAVRMVVSRGLQPVTVPNLVGKQSEAAQAQLASIGLKTTITGQAFSSKVPKGAVLTQTPNSGQVPQGSVIELTISKGPKLFQVPNVFGKRTSEAVSILKSAGFRVDVQKVLGGLLDRVQAQSPGAGSQQPKGTLITIRVV